MSRGFTGSCLLAAQFVPCSLQRTAGDETFRTAWNFGIASANDKRRTARVAAVEPDLPFDVRLFEQIFVYYETEISSWKTREKREKVFYTREASVVTQFNCV